MRTMLLPGLLETARRNVFVREDRVRIFEVGRVFEPGEEVLPREKTRVGMLIAGDWDDASWLRSGAAVDYYLVKGILDRVAAGRRCRLEYGVADERFLHPGKSAIAQDAQGRMVGWLGELHPLVLQAYDLRGPAVAAEICLDHLVGASGALVIFRDLIAYPLVEQDVALVVDAGIPAAEVIRQLREAGGDLLEDVVVFDLYEGTQIPSGKRSLALRLCFRAADRTLSDAEVGEIRERMLATVSRTLGAQLRA
jgi:phenylalanyl-tRNA synthetase beta chain